ncbi:MAG: sigma-70 family RNA polymerase sigma factor [Chitinophagaceae bacterium]
MLTNPTYTETELLAALKAHDEQAYSFLYDHYSKALFALILQIIPQHTHAEDVLQDVFIKIWQNIHSYDATKGRLYTWIINIARNQAIDRSRSKDFNNQAKTITLPDSVYNRESNSGRSIDDVGLVKVLSKLPDENRKLLELSYFQGYTHEEIAQILKLPLGTVKTRIRSTIIQLRKVLGEKNT